MKLNISLLWVVMAVLLSVVSNFGAMTDLLSGQSSLGLPTEGRNSSKPKDFPHDSFFVDLVHNSTSPFVAGLTFETFDKNKNGVICIDEFGLLCRALFQNADNVIYPIEQSDLQKFYEIFDVNHDERIDVQEFKKCWDKWIKKILGPSSAFIVIDVQNDFISGSLAVSKYSDYHDGSAVIDPINRLANGVNFNRLYYSLDWHPENHISFLDNIRLRKLDNSSKIQNPDDANILDTVVFAGNPPIKQILWPRHCVQNSWGAELSPDLTVPSSRIIVYKGMNPEIDSYSALFDNGKISSTTLVEDLKNSGITDCYFSGLAYDVCVASSAMDASDLGYRTIIVDDASGGINLQNVEKVKEKIKKSHGLIVHSSQVLAMVQGRDRPLELGLKLALKLKTEGIIVTI